MDAEYWKDVSFIGSAYDMEISRQGKYRHRRALPTRNHLYRAFGAGDDDYLFEAGGGWIDGMAPDFSQKKAEKMTQKSVTNQLSKHYDNASFTLEDLYRVIQKIRSTSPQEQSLKVTPLERMQIRRLDGIQRVIEINEDGEALFGMRIEVEY